MLDTWNLLINELSLLSSIQVPRCYYRLKQTPVSVQLHGFSDASELAYAAVVYIRCDYGENDVETRLVTAKSRVAPLKRQTIPRLELLGTLILARLMEGLVSHLRGVIEVYCWTDSMTVLLWIRNKNIYRQYVQSRINEIRQRTNGFCWQHCPGNVNPADLPSRGMSAKQMVNSSMWWNGPEFLKLPAKEWPMAQVDGIGTEAKAELVKHPPIITHSILSLGVEGRSLLKISEAVKADKYSSYHFLLRVSAYVIRFIDRVTASNRKSSQLPVTATEIRDAE